MKRFEISISSSKSGSLNISLSVEANSWMEALQLGSDELSGELGLAPEFTASRRDISIEIRDCATGRRYHVSTLAEQSPGELPATPRQERPRPPTTLEASHARPQDAATYGVTARRPKSGKLPTVVQSVGAETSPRPTAVLVDAPPGDTKHEVQRRPGRARAHVVTPKIRKHHKPNRMRSIPTLQDTPAIDPSATLLDIDAGANRKAPAPPVVNNDSLQRVRTMIRPVQGQAEGQSPYFRPVAAIANEASTLIELIDAAVNMAYDHVPCEAVQCLLVEDGRSELYVAAARGTFAREVHRGLLTPPSYIEPTRMCSGPASLSIDQAGELTYQSRNGIVELDLVTALWLPVSVDNETIAVMLLANSKHREGFSQGERRGAEYLTATLGREMGLFLTTKRDQ